MKNMLCSFVPAVLCVLLEGLTNISFLISPLLTEFFNTRQVLFTTLRLVLRMSFISYRTKLMRLIVLFLISWIFILWMEQFIRPSSQTTWLKVKPNCNLVMATLSVPVSASAP